MAGSTRGRVVVGIDGSHHADEALRWAADEAERRQADLEVVLVWEFPLLPYYVAPTDPIAPDEIQEAARRRLDEAVATVVPEGIGVTKTLAEGRPAETLVRLAKGADLLVVGSRGHGGFTALLLGSVSQHCATHAPCPVAIIRPVT